MPTITRRRDSVGIEIFASTHLEADGQMCDHLNDVQLVVHHERLEVIALLRSAAAGGSGEPLDDLDWPGLAGRIGLGPAPDRCRLRAPGRTVTVIR